jgi:hypothetical protein
MKKLLLRIGVGLIVLIVLVILGISLFLDGAVKRGIETIGPKLTQVSVKLDNVSLSLLSGAGAIKGLVVGNPAGFKTPQAIRVGSASLALQPRSLFADKVVIKSIRVDAPEITFEYGTGGNNLSKILANVQSAAGSSTNAAAKEESAGKKLEVDEFTITGAKVNVALTQLGGKTVAVTLPDIHLTDLGKGPEGITSAELTKVVLSTLERAVLKAADSAVANLGKDLSKSADKVVKDLGKGGTGTVDNVTKSLNDLFKKK